MQKSDNDLGYPADWGTEDFPHPNPYFPDVPRPKVQSLWAQVGKGFAYFVILAILIPFLMHMQGQDLSWLFNLEILLIFVPFVAVSCGLMLLFLLNRDHKKVWRYSFIIPALVMKHQQDGIPTKMAKFVLEASVRVVAGVGVGGMPVMYFVGGSMQKGQIENNAGALGLLPSKFEIYYGDCIWVILDQEGNLHNYYQYVPSSQKSFPPLEARAWLLDRLGFEINSTQQLLNANELRQYDKEQKHAAKANSKAAASASKYE